MAQRYGAETTVPDWSARLVCSLCGSREVDNGGERDQAALVVQIIRRILAGMQDFLAFRAEAEGICRSRGVSDLRFARKIVHAISARRG
jgi:hypothetical protein